MEQFSQEENIMSLLKEMVARGIYYDRLGVHDYAIWSEMMIDYYGTEVTKDIREIRKWSILIPWVHDISVSRLNCWEFMGCGLQLRGKRVRAEDSALCPAARETRFNGVHGGENAGRACWMVPNTHCNRTFQGSREEKTSCCINCAFYRSVQEEEARGFIQSNTLMEILKQGKAADGSVYQHKDT